MGNPTQNVSYPLRLQLSDGNTAQYPSALIYNTAGTLVTTLSLSHVAGGLYSAAWTFPTLGVFTAVFKVYSDAGRTTLAAYDVAAEELKVEAAVPSTGAVQGLVPQSTSSGLISMFRGDTNQVTVTAQMLQNDGTYLPYDLTGGSARLTVRKRIGDAVALAKTGTILAPATDGRIQFTFAPADTVSLTPGVYQYDVEITTAASAVYTVVRSTFEVREDVST